MHKCVPQATYGIGVVSKVRNDSRSKFLEIVQFRAQVSRNIERILAAKAEDAIQNVCFRGEKHQASNTDSSFLTFITDANSGVLVFNTVIFGAWAALFYLGTICLWCAGDYHTDVTEELFILGSRVASGICVMHLFV